MLRHLLVLWVLGTLMSTAGAGSRLEAVLESATRCTDGLVHLHTSQSCDPPSQIATSAVSACQAQWDALAREAVRAPRNGDDAGEAEAYRKRLWVYADGMKHEYAKIAELKAIDIRRAGDCPE